MPVEFGLDALAQQFQFSPEKTTLLGEIVDALTQTGEIHPENTVIMQICAADWGIGRTETELAEFLSNIRQMNNL